MKNSLKIDDLNIQYIEENKEAVLKIASDVPDEYWNIGHFLLPLEKKWELSFCINSNNFPIGYVIASKKCEDCHIHHFMVSKDFRSSGIGSLMLLEIEKRALNANLNYLLLKVLKKNLNAVNFYLYKKFKVLKKDIGMNDDYLLMGKKLSGGKTVAIHQPNYLPWGGYFYKIANADIFIFLDDVQYTKNSFINRNYIKTPQGKQWLTIPVRFNLGQNINETQFSGSSWRKKHIKTIEQNYKKAPAFKETFPIVKEVIEDEKNENIAQLNTAIIKVITKYLGLKVEFYSSSSFDVEGTGDERLINLIQVVGGNSYLSGRGGEKYQYPEKFTNLGIGFSYYDYTPNEYPQLWGDFIPGLSILDMLFNCGKDCFKVLLES